MKLIKLKILKLFYNLIKIDKIMCKCTKYLNIIILK